MRKTEKAARIAQILDQLFPEVDIPLRHRDPFTLLVAVVLSAQSTDRKVNEVTPRLFALASTPQDMAKLSVEEIQQCIRPLGLAPQKARNLLALSQMLVNEYGGQVPRTMEELTRLPGVGRKTASVVLQQAFGLPAFPVDTHIHRLAARWGLSDGTSPERTEQDLRRLFPPDRWGKLHLQMIYFGRKYCPARGHDPQACPICSWAAPGRRAPARRP
ncbi:MAG TPA: endonuclease III [Candidatus Nitrosotenuis sp.]|nr:endonuclease III [Candidatus Nitrosotenuis sp.]